MGNVPGVRGQPWAQLSAPPEGRDGDGRPPYRMITYGTLTRACYRAFEEDPSNLSVRMSIEAGLENAQIYRHKTPKDVTDFLRDFHNDFHGGSGFSAIDYLKLSLKAESQWTAHAALNGMEVSNQNARQKWLQEKFPGRFKTSNLFNEAKSTAHLLKRMNMFDEVLMLLGSCCDFTEAKNDQLIHAIHEIAALVNSKFSGAFSERVTRIILTELI
eukprot:4148019-Pyramimonas_sp.AAC.1